MTEYHPYIECFLSYYEIGQFEQFLYGLTPLNNLLDIFIKLFQSLLKYNIKIQSEKRTYKSRQENGDGKKTSHLPFHISAGVNEFIHYTTDNKT